MAPALALTRHSAARASSSTLCVARDLTRSVLCELLGSPPRNTEIPLTVGWHVVTARLSRCPESILVATLVCCPCQKPLSADTRVPWGSSSSPAIANACKWHLLAPRYPSDVWCKTLVRPYSYLSGGVLALRGPSCWRCCQTSRPAYSQRFTGQKPRLKTVPFSDEWTSGSGASVLNRRRAFGS